MRRRFHTQRTSRFLSLCLIVSLAVLFLTPVSLRAANVTVNVDYTNQRQTLEGLAHPQRGSPTISMHSPQRGKHKFSIFSTTHPSLALV